MESANRLKPRLSVIVPALLGLSSVRAALDAWDAQTCRDELELLVLVPDDAPASPAGPTPRLVPIGSRMLHEARAAAIREARADFVFIAEDHCLPDPGTAESLLNTIETASDDLLAVGLALRPGNRRTIWSRGAFLVAYGQWLLPQSGFVDVLPGHNNIYRREPLLELAGELEHELLIGTFLQKRLYRERAFYLNNQASMRHFDPPSAQAELRISGTIGLAFGARRTEGWPAAARWGYWLLTPLVAAAHWRRAWRSYRRAGRRADLGPGALAASAVLAACWAGGEAVGALMGVPRVAPYIRNSEIKPVSRADVREAASV